MKYGNLTTEGDDVELTDEQFAQREAEITQKSIDSMIQAFNRCYDQLKELQSQQENIANHIRQRVDKEKIEHIRNTLNKINS